MSELQQSSVVYRAQAEGGWSGGRKKEQNRGEAGEVGCTVEYRGDGIEGCREVAWLLLCTESGGHGKRRRPVSCCRGRQVGG